jgi:hypothetical protein
MLSALPLCLRCRQNKSINYLISYQRFSLNNLSITAANATTMTELFALHGWWAWVKFMLRNQGLLLLA